MPLIKGVLFGLTLAVMLGPIFFALLQTSISKGFNKAVLMAIGVSIGDIIFILLAYFGFSKWVGFEENKEVAGYAGAIILAIFGLVSIFKKESKKQVSTDMAAVKGFFRFFFKGLVVNAISPFVPIFWLVTMSLARAEYGYQDTDLVVFFVTIVSVVFITDTLKAYLAHRLSSIITLKVMRILNVSVGLILILFAIRMATYAW